MDHFVPNKQNLREVLLYLFNIEKSTAESNRLFVEAYDNNTSSERLAYSGLEDLKNRDFIVENKDREEVPKILRTLT